MKKVIQSVYLDDNVRHTAELSSWISQNTDCGCIGTNDINIFCGILAAKHPDIVIIGDVEPPLEPHAVIFALLHSLRPAYEARPYISVLTTGVKNEHYDAKNSPMEYIIPRRFRTLCTEHGADEVMIKPVAGDDVAKWIERAKRRNQTTNWLAGVDINKDYIRR